MSTNDTIRFSGYEWKVKNTSQPSGPGDNLFSPDNVWVDDKGLHLAIKQVDGEWRCASISTMETLGYGRYIFYLANRFDKLDENVVLGMFIYKHDKHEIDIELRRREDHNGVFTVQGGESQRFSAKLEGAYTTHRFRWEPSRVLFQSIHGHNRNPPTPAHLISKWQTTKNIPKSDREKVHINLWMRKGRTPARPTEIIIKKFEFIPVERVFTTREKVVAISVFVGAMLLILWLEYQGMHLLVSAALAFFTAGALGIRRKASKPNSPQLPTNRSDPEGLRRPDDEEDDSGIGAQV